MRNLLLIGVAALLLGSIGCGTDEENRRAKIEDDRQFWGGLEHKPDIALGTETMPTVPTVANKVPTAGTSAPTVVQVSGQTTATLDDSDKPSIMSPDRTHGGVR